VSGALSLAVPDDVRKLMRERANIGHFPLRVTVAVKALIDKEHT
jgi:hypothetical protein